MILRFIKLDVVKLNFPERGWNEGQDVVMVSEPTPFFLATHLLLDQIHVRRKNDHLFSSLLTPGSLSISSTRFGCYVRCDFGVILMLLHFHFCLFLFRIIIYSHNSFVSIYIYTRKLQTSGTRVVMINEMHI